MINTHDSPVQNRVAIVGTGLAGLTTAHLLHNDQERRYRVTLFEQVRILRDALYIAPV
jgi:2-polyprenyl-6-methoxyphenol hydroxylase-like FAD-dependent oxidoreductase